MILTLMINSFKLNNQIKLKTMKTLILTTVSAIVFSISACNSEKKSESAGSDSSTIQTAGVSYTCSMHPEVISDKPGKCPKCNMDLIEKK